MLEVSLKDRRKMTIGERTKVTDIAHRISKWKWQWTCHVRHRTTGSRRVLERRKRVGKRSQHELSDRWTGCRGLRRTVMFGVNLEKPLSRSGQLLTETYQQIQSGVRLKVNSVRIRGRLAVVQVFKV